MSLIGTTSAIGILLLLTACASIGQSTQNLSQPSAPQNSPNLTELATGSELASVPKNASTVKDYLLAMPKRYIQPPNEALSKERLDELCKRGKCDIENGYIELSNDAGGMIVTIFSRPSGVPIVAVSQYTTMGEDVVFLDPDRNWQDVTSQIVPNFSDRLSYELPRYGTKIAVREKQVEDGRPTFPFPQAPPIYNLVWKKGVFERSN